MTVYSTRETAKKLGITQPALSKYIKAGKIPTPKVVTYGRFRVHAWTEADIERVRKLLPKIKNGRKTRYQEKQSALSSQQLVRVKNKKKKSSTKEEINTKSRFLSRFVGSE